MLSKLDQLVVYAFFESHLVFLTVARIQTGLLCFVIAVFATFPYQCVSTTPLAACQSESLILRSNDSLQVAVQYAFAVSLLIWLFFLKVTTSIYSLRLYFTLNAWLQLDVAYAILKHCLQGMKQSATFSKDLNLKTIALQIFSVLKEKHYLACYKRVNYLSYRLLLISLQVASKLIVVVLGNWISKKQFQYLFSRFVPNPKNSYQSQINLIRASLRLFVCIASLIQNQQREEVGQQNSFDFSRKFFNRSLQATLHLNQEQIFD